MASADATQPRNEEAASPAEGNGEDGLPQWLQPGVSPGIHMGLRAVLFVLNGLLGWCALVQILSPHFEFMFLLSLGLTGSYFWFVWEVSKMQPQSDSSGSKETGSETASGDVSGRATGSSVGENGNGMGMGKDEVKKEQ